MKKWWQRGLQQKKETETALKSTKSPEYVDPDSDDSVDEQEPAVKRLQKTQELFYADPSTSLLVPPVKNPQKHQTPKGMMIKTLRKKVQQKISLPLAAPIFSHLV